MKQCNERFYFGASTTQPGWEGNHPGCEGNIFVSPTRYPTLLQSRQG